MGRKPTHNGKERPCAKLYLQYLAVSHAQVDPDLRHCQKPDQNSCQATLMFLCHFERALIKVTKRVHLNPTPHATLLLIECAHQQTEEIEREMLAIFGQNKWDT